MKQNPTLVPLGRRLLVLGVLVLLWVPTFSARADVVDRIVLRVNDRIATLQEYEDRKTDAIRQIRALEGPAEEKQRLLEEVGRLTLRAMFDELLMLSRADQLGLRMTEEEVDRDIAALRTRAGLDSDDQFAAILARDGYSLASLREVRRRVRLREQVIERELVPQVDLDEDDLRRYYRAHQDEFALPARRSVREFVVLEAEDLSEADLLLRATELVGRLRAGESLESVVAESSAAGQTTGVIDLGAVRQGELAPELEPVVWQLEASQVSEPIKARGGLHVLLVDNIEEARVKAFKEVQDEIWQIEVARVRGKVERDYLRGLESKAFVQQDPPADALGFREAEVRNEQADPFAGFEEVEGESGAPQDPPSEG